LEVHAVSIFRGEDGCSMDLQNTVADHHNTIPHGVTTQKNSNWNITTVKAPKLSTI
jgi:hypothetical protein